MKKPRKARSNKTNTRKDGKPTRRDRTKANSSSFRNAKREFSLYIPASVAARYEGLLREVRAGAIKTDEDKQKAILSLIMGGMPLRRSREVVDVTHYMWHSWLADSEQLRKDYALAKDERTEAWADDIVEDAESANAFNVQAVRLRIETKKWLMGKNSGRYADKVVLAGDPNAPLHHVSREMTAEEAQEAYAAMKKASGS